MTDEPQVTQTVADRRPAPRATKLDAQLLPKRYALPIFASDPLSSVAYAPQELLMILLIGGSRSSPRPGLRLP